MYVKGVYLVTLSLCSVVGLAILQQSTSYSIASVQSQNLVSIVRGRDALITTPTITADTTQQKQPTVTPSYDPYTITLYPTVPVTSSTSNTKAYTQSASAKTAEPSSTSSPPYHATITFMVNNHQLQNISIESVSAPADTNFTVQLMTQPTIYPNTQENFKVHILYPIASVPTSIPLTFTFSWLGGGATITYSYRILS